ncbi:WecB/TagA/CpsF family glycosyltransferase [Pediococcus siamensis]|uniref:WecB/TagA/CpsF family glycosyltransferase n=1 Tax=Pediococcus siamensis TaxID=381829 RepID=UPI0039A2B76D
MLNSPFSSVPIMGIPFAQTTRVQFVNHLQNRIDAHQNTFVITANPEIVMYAGRNPAYHTTLLSADYISADGIGIVKAAQALDTPLPERITGYDIFTDLLRWAETNQKKVYFLGAKPAVITALAAKVAHDFPHIQVVGAQDGYYQDETAITTAIANHQPDLIFVATGFPKQEQFIAEHRHLADGLWMGVGGSFDVFVGAVKRAPKFWQDHHLEWFYRLVTDPRRLKRQLIIPQFMWKIHQLKHKRD